MIAGTTYRRVKSFGVAHGIVTNKPPYYTGAGDLSRLLLGFGVLTAKGRRLRHWDSLQCLSVVGINHNEAADTWHWVVYVPSAAGGYVLDPKKTIKAERRVDFGRMHPRSYMPVLRPNNSIQRTLACGSRR
ncbi:MAG: hypothetical protein ACRETW_10310 [Stenotrophobium sp.]